MALNFETKRVRFAAPLDLSSDTDIAIRPDADPTSFAYIENTGTAQLYWRETTAEPDPLTERGHILEVGAALVVLVYAGRSFWLWSATGGGEVMISPAAPQPTRNG